MSEAIWRVPYLQDQQIRVFLGELGDKFVHLFAWLDPWSPEINKRDPVQVGGQEFLEVIG